MVIKQSVFSSIAVDRGTHKWPKIRGFKLFDPTNVAPSDTSIDENQVPQHFNLFHAMVVVLLFFSHKLSRTC